jgi:hypothetical protein
MKISLFSHFKANIDKSPTLTPDGNGTDNTILQLVSPCPACGKKQVEKGDGHEYALLASEIARESSPDLLHFFELYKNREWSELAQIRRFEGAFNAALIYVVRCGGGMTVVVVRSPVELYESDSVLEAVVLDAASAEAIESLHIAFESV